MSSNDQLQTIFVEALAKQSPEERQAYLQEACGTDEKLHRQVRELLNAHEDAAGFLATQEDHTSPKGKEQLSTGGQRSEGPGAVIHNYKLLQEIGEGGFGIVYMAEQKQPIKRKVAFKVIKPGMDTRQVVARFEAERQALALMDHPNIARVLDAGTTDAGRPFFVMELVKGVPIIEFCDRNKLPMEERLRIFLNICSAVQHAHQKGIIHRDLKPSNILITLHDGKPVPKVIDFGIAKALNQELTEKSLFTAYGQMIGTPQYMSPEQAEMSGLDVDTRSDIYSLGVLLYELMTGRTPIDAKSLRKAGFDEMKRIIQEEEAHKPSLMISTMGDVATSVADHRKVDPRKLSETLKGDLDWIVMKALEKDRSRRYESAAAFAHDIDRHLNHEPVEAAAPSPIYLLKKFSRKYKRTVASAAAIFISLLLGIIGMTWLYAKAKSDRLSAVEAREHAQQQAQIAQQEKAGAEAAREAERSQREEADRERSKAEAALSLAKQKQEEAETAQANEVAARTDALREAETRRQALYSADMQLAAHFWENDSGSVASVDRLLSTHMPVGNQKDLRDFAWRHQWHEMHRSALFTRTMAGKFASVFTPDGNLITCDHLGEIVVWDLDDQKEIRRLQLDFTDKIRALTLSQDGAKLAVWTQKFNLNVYDTMTGENLWDRNGRVFSSHREFSADGNTLFSFNGISKLQFQTLDLLNGSFKKVAVGATSTRFPQFALAPDASSAVIIDPRAPVRIKVVSLENETSYLLEGKGNSIITSVAWSQNGDYIAYGDPNGHIYLWRTSDRELHQSISGHTSKVSVLTFSYDGTRLASGAGNGMVKLWNISTGQQLDQFKGHTSEIQQLTFSRDGTKLSSTDFADGVEVDSKGSLRVWSIDSDRGDKRVLTNTDGIFYRFNRSPDGRWLSLSQKPDGFLLYDIEEGISKPMKGRGRATAFSPDSKLLATVNPQGDIFLNQLSDDTLLATLENGVDVGSLDFSPDGRYLAAGAGNPFSISRRSVSEDSLNIWDVENGVLIHHLLHDADHMGDVAFSPTDSKLAAAGHDGVVSLWDTVTWKLIRNHRTTRSPFISVTFSPDGSNMAGGAMDGTIYLWDVDSGALLFILEGHGNWVSDLSFSPDGRTLASASWDSTIKLWNPETGLETRTLTGHKNWVNGIRFSVDGNTLFSSGYEGKLLQWEALPLQEIDRNPETSKSLYNLATVYQNRGEHRTAELYYSKAYNLQRTYLGATHMDTIASMDQIAFCMEGQGKYMEAIETWQQLFELLLLSRPEEIQDRVESLVDQVMRASDQIKLQAKEDRPLADYIPLLKKQLKMVKKYSGDQSIMTLKWMIHLGEVLAEMGQVDASLEYYREARPMTETHDIDQFNVSYRLGQLLTQVQQYQAAENILRGLLKTELDQFQRHQTQVALAIVLYSDESKETLVEAKKLFNEVYFITNDESLKTVITDWMIELSESTGSANELVVWKTNQEAQSGHHASAQSTLDRLQAELENLDNIDRDFVSLLQKTRANIYRFQVQKYGSQKRYEDCIEALRILVQLSPDNLEYQIQLANAHAALGNKIQYERICKQLLAKSTSLTTPRLKIQLAATCLLLPEDPSSERLIESIDYALSLVDEFPSRPDAALVAGLASVRSGQFAEASRFLQKGLRSPNLIFKGASIHVIALRNAMAGRKENHLAALGMTQSHLKRMRNTRFEESQWSDLILHDVLYSEARDTPLKLKSIPFTIPAREQTTPSNLLDLSTHYSASISKSWFNQGGGPFGNKAPFNAGVQSYDGVSFDVRGVIQLSGDVTRSYGVYYSRETEAIMLASKGKKLHFLHAAAINSDGSTPEVGNINVQYADGTHVVVPLKIGHNSLDWMDDGPKQTLADPHSSIVVESVINGEWVKRLVHTIWVNPDPEKRIDHLQIVSADQSAAPMVFAITLEE